jgi:hypothetical protein
MVSARAACSCDWREVGGERVRVIAASQEPECRGKTCRNWRALPPPPGHVVETIGMPGWLSRRHAAEASHRAKPQLRATCAILLRLGVSLTQLGRVRVCVHTGGIDAMSSQHAVTYGEYRAVVISMGRSGVLSDLFDDARLHFGNCRVSVSDVRVTPVPGCSGVLASAMFRQCSPPTAHQHPGT